MKPFFLALLLSISTSSFAQIDSSLIGRIKALDTANVLKADTVDVPNDRLTQKIRSLLNEKSGLSIETLLKIKIAEEQQKDTSHPKEFYEKLLAEVTKGKTSKLIEKSIINLYRRTYSKKEINELIRFFKTSAGKKMDSEYLIMLVESVKVAEQLIGPAMKAISKTQ